MPKNILVDTSCLILLSKIGRLNFLHDLFDSIKTTTIVKQEFRKPLPAWIEIIDSKEADYLPLLSSADPGEASILTEALKLEEPILIIDDAKARKIAQSLDLSITGTLGILILAKKKGLISKVRPELDKIQNTDFRLSKRLINKVLKMTNEK